MSALKSGTGFSERLKQLMKRFGKGLKAACRFLFNPRFMLCFGLAWMLTNGWSYLGFLLGKALDIPWLKYISTGYMALLWLPFTPEKIITFAIAILLLKLIFPNDTKTLAVLHDMKEKAKREFHEFLERRRAKKRQKRAGSGNAPPLPAAEIQPETEPTADTFPSVHGASHK